MKAIFTLMLISSISTISFTQEKVELNIAGIATEVENRIIPGDRVSFFHFDDGGSSTNVIVEVKTAGGKKRFFESFDIRADENGHYDFTGKVEIKETSKVKFDGEIELEISMPTIFGNAIWATTKRTIENISEPIILNKYTQRAGEEYDARKRLSLNFSAIAYDNELKKKVTDNGDTWRNRKRSDYRFMLKNEGDSNWKINEIASAGKMTNVDLNAFIDYNDELDLARKIIMRVEVTTEQGNMLWNEVEFEARGMTRVYFGRNYEIKNQEETLNESTHEDNEVVNEIVEEKEEIEKEEKEEKNSKIEMNEGKQLDKIEGGNTKPSSTIDLTTQTLKVDCQNITKGDTVLLVSGSSVCVNGMKAEGSKYYTATLSGDCNFKIGEVIYPISGNSSIKIMKSTGALAEGVLRANMEVNTSAGTVKLKGGEKVVFYNNLLIAGSLSEPLTLNVLGSDVKCTPNEKSPYDIRFDNKGDLLECSVAESYSYSDRGLEFSFPALSRMVFKVGKLNKVIASEESVLNLNGETIKIGSNSVSASFDFNAQGELISVLAASGNVLEIAGQKIEVMANSEMKLNFTGEKYEIQKFFVAKEVTVKVDKKGKMKEVVVKPGKKIVLEGGKIVKAG